MFLFSNAGNLLMSMFVQFLLGKRSKHGILSQPPSNTVTVCVTIFGSGPTVH